MAELSPLRRRMIEDMTGADQCGLCDPQHDVDVGE